ncbi:MAG: hypothetical protein KUG77_01165 [Nannocystaceae bacterium]|nr:hypothetical protein [Nannocystaceae bacterium]
MRPVHRSRWLASLALASLALSGCKKEGPSDLPICKAEVAGKEADEVAAGSVPPDIWFLILLRNFDRNTMQLKRPGQDCSGRTIEPKAEAIDTCIVGDEPAKPLPARPLTEDDLLIEALDDGRQLVWAKTGEYDNGEAVGPIAITEWTSRGVAVRAIGTLRAQEDRAAIRLETLGAEQILVVESRHCDDPKNCSRRIRLLPLIGDSFVDKRLQTEEGACIGSAEVTLYEEKLVALDNGIERKFEVARSVEFEEGVVVINEQVTIKDSDPSQPDLPAKLFRRANVQRSLNVGLDAIVTQSGLWDDMLSKHGSVEVREPAAVDEGADAPSSE